jgi:aspartyl-tRNA(Asn)/glutamyl-tRNA(Gln) amidotransferase subunit A
MSNEDLCYLSASAALALFGKRKLSPLELMTDLISRAEQVNPAINCFADRYYEQALLKARAAEARYMKRGGGTAPLLRAFHWP